MIKLIIFFVLSLILIEFLIFILFLNLKKNFQWLIGREDINPNFTKKKYKNFLNKNYDQVLGWDRKPSTKGFEKSKNSRFSDLFS